MQTAPNYGVEWAYDYVTDIANGRAVQLEDKLTFTCGKKVLYFGYADVVCEDHIFDYKESAEGYYRPQLNGYAAAHMQSTFRDEVTCHVLYGQTQRADVWTITAEEAEEYVAEMFSLIEAKDKKPTANEYCKWCRHLSSCEGVNALMVKAISGGLQMSFASPERLAEVRKHLPVIKAWVDGVDKLTKSTMEEGGEVPGFKLSWRKGKQSVLNTDFFQHLAYEAATRNIDSFELLKFCNITVPHAKEVFLEIIGEELPEHFLQRGKKYSVVLEDKTKKIE